MVGEWMAYVWEAEEDPSLRAAVWGHCNSLFVEQRARGRPGESPLSPRPSLCSPVLEEGRQKSLL